MPRGPGRTAPRATRSRGPSRRHASRPRAAVTTSRTASGSAPAACAPRRQRSQKQPRSRTGSAEGLGQRILSRKTPSHGPPSMAATSRSRAAPRPSGSTGQSNANSPSSRVPATGARPPPTHAARARTDRHRSATDATATRWRPGHARRAATGSTMCVAGSSPGRRRRRAAARRPVADERRRRPGRSRPDAPPSRYWTMTRERSRAIDPTGHHSDARGLREVGGRRHQRGQVDRGRVQTLGRSEVVDHELQPVW